MRPHQDVDALPTQAACPSEPPRLVHAQLAKCATITYSQDWSSTQNYTQAQTLNLQQFDAHLGTLTGVELAVGVLIPAHRREYRFSAPIRSRSAATPW